MGTNIEELKAAIDKYRKALEVAQEELDRAIQIRETMVKLRLATEQSSQNLANELLEQFDKEIKARQLDVNTLKIKLLQAENALLGSSDAPGDVVIPSTAEKAGKGGGTIEDQNKTIAADPSAPSVSKDYIKLLNCGPKDATGFARLERPKAAPAFSICRLEGHAYPLWVGYKVDLASLRRSKPVIRKRPQFIADPEKDLATNAVRLLPPNEWGTLTPFDAVPLARPEMFPANPEAAIATGYMTNVLPLSRAVSRQSWDAASKLITSLALHPDLNELWIVAGGTGIESASLSLSYGDGKQVLAPQQAYKILVGKWKNGKLTVHGFLFDNQLSGLYDNPFDYAKPVDDILAQVGSWMNAFEPLHTPDNKILFQEVQPWPKFGAK